MKGEGEVVSIPHKMTVAMLLGSATVAGHMLVQAYLPISNFHQLLKRAHLFNMCYSHPTFKSQRSI